MRDLPPTKRQKTTTDSNTSNIDKDSEFSFCNEDQPLYKTDYEHEIYQPKPTNEQKNIEKSLTSMNYVLEKNVEHTELTEEKEQDKLMAQTSWTDEEFKKLKRKGVYNWDNEMKKWTEDPLTTPEEYEKTVETEEDILEEISFIQRFNIYTPYPGVNASDKAKMNQQRKDYYDSARKRLIEAATRKTKGDADGHTIRHAYY